MRRFLLLCALTLAWAVPASAQVTPVIYPPNIPASCPDTQGIVFSASTGRWVCGAVGGSGAVGTDVIWDAAGDLAVGTGANTAARLAVGTALQVLRVNAGATALEWAAASGAMVTDTLWDAAGDLAQGTGSNTGARLAIGTANQLLRVNAGATGAEWASTLSGLTFVAPALGAATATTLDTGQGANELFDMDQNVLTTSDVTFNILILTAAAVLPDNIRQTFNPGATVAGLNVGSIAGDPSTPTNGDLWYDSTAGELTARIAGANVALGAGGGGAIATDTIWDVAGDTVYGTGSNTAVRLAAGTGLQYYRMNAGATAPEWATLSIALASQVTGDLPAANLFQCATDTVASNITSGTADIACNTYAALLADMGIIASAAAPSEDRLAFYDFSATQIDYLLPGTGVQASLAIAMTGSGGFAGSTSPAITTSITSPSTTFGLLDATVTTLNAFDAVTTANLFGASGAAVNIGGGANAAEVRLLEPSGGGTSYTGFKAPALGATLLWTLPPSTSAGCAWTDTAGDGVLACTVPAGSGNVAKVGTPANNQGAVWTGDGTIEGTSDWTYDGTSWNLITAKNFQIAGVTVLSDAAGTTTLDNIDALATTTENTIEAAIDTLANLTSIQGQTFTLSAGAFIRSGAHSLTLTTTGTTNVTLPTTGTLATLAGTEAFTGKTLDCEATGNVCAGISLYDWTAGVSQAGTASVGLNLPTTNPCAAVDSGQQTAPFATCDFDAATDEFAHFNWKLPATYNGSGTVTAIIDWFANATTGAARFCINTTAKAASGAMASYTFDDEVCSDATTDATANDLNQTTITMDVSDWAASAIAFAMVSRDANHANDTLAVDARVMRVQILWRYSY